MIISSQIVELYSRLQAVFMDQEENCSAVKKEDTNEVQVNVVSEKTGWDFLKSPKEDSGEEQVNKISEKTGWDVHKRLKEDTNEEQVNKISEKTGWELLLYQSFNFHEWFTWNDFMSGLILCFAPTALDIGTDFNLARQTHSTQLNLLWCDSKSDLFRSTK